MQTRFHQGLNAMSSSRMRAVLVSLAGILTILAFPGCATSGVSDADPFETRLMTLEQRAMYARSSKVRAEQDAIRRANASFVDVQLPEPDYSEGPDVVAPQSKVAASRKGAPIGKVTAN